MQNWREYYESNLQMKKGQVGPWLTAHCPLIKWHNNADQNPSLCCNEVHGGCKCHGCGVSGNMRQLWKDFNLPQPQGEPFGYTAKYIYRTAGGGEAYTVYRMEIKRSGRK